MKRLLRAAAMLCCVAMLACCGQPDLDSETSSDTVAVTKESREDIALIQDGTCCFRVVRPERAAEDVVDAVADFYRTLSAFVPNSLELATDFLPAGEAYDTETVEILVGETAYAESARFYQTLGYDGYGYRIDGNKLVVGGSSSEMLYRAMSDLANTLRRAVVRDDEGQLQLMLKRDELALEQHTGGPISQIPLYAEGKTTLICDAGDDATLVVVGSTTAAAYDAYLDQLVGAGLSCWSEKEIAGNRYATLADDTVKVDVWYTDFSREVRIVAGRRDGMPDAAGAEPPAYAVAATPQMTVLGGDRVGMMLLFRLSDGRFVIVDGGNGPHSGEQLFTAMREQAPDPEHMVVAAWIFTHSHQDHIAAFGQLARGELTALTEGLVIERFICNFPGEVQGNVQTQRLAGSDRELRGFFANCFADSPVCKAHPGNTFTFADMTVEVLGTQESYLTSTYPEMYNACCLFLRVTIAGQCIVLPADSDATNNRVIAQMYGDYLKCDILQADHHGGFGGTVEINRLLSPETVIYFTNEENFAKYSLTDYNQCLLTSPSYRRHFVVGAGQHVLPLPYRG